MEMFEFVLFSIFAVILTSFLAGILYILSK